MKADTSAVGPDLPLVPTRAPAPTTAPPPPPSPAPPPKWLVLLAFGVVYVVWGSTYLGIKVAIETLPPLLMASGRAVVAGGLLYAWLRLRGAPAPARGHWLAASGLGALMLLLGNGGVSWAEQRVPSALASLVIAVTPLWITLLDWVRPGGARPGVGRVAGLALGFGGVALIVGAKGPVGQTLVDPVGAAVLLTASFSWAVGTVWSRHLAQAKPVLLAVAMQMIAGGVLMFAAGLALGEGRDFALARVSAASAWAFAYLTLIGSLVGFTAYAWLLTVSTPARVSTYAYVNPLIAVFLGWSLGHEPISGSVLLAAALVIGAVVLITGRNPPAVRENP